VWGEVGEKCFPVCDDDDDVEALRDINSNPHHPSLNPANNSSILSGIIVEIKAPENFLMLKYFIIYK
jgi:hypothetical protein